jgi:hypothetical protein
MQLSTHSLFGLPNTQKSNKQVVGEAAEQHLAEQEDLRRQGRLQHDRHVGRVKQTDRVVSTSTTLTSRLDRNVNAKSLKVDDGGEDDESG